MQLLAKPTVTTTTNLHATRFTQWPTKLCGECAASGKAPAGRSWLSHLAFMLSFTVGQFCVVLHGMVVMVVLVPAVLVTFVQKDPPKHVFFATAV